MQKEYRILFKNARVMTSGVALDYSILVEGNRVAWVGPKAHAPAASVDRVVDCQGSTLMPGFSDSHMHLGMGAAWMAAADLRGVTNLTELADRLKQYASEHPEAEFVEAAWTPYDLLPNRQLLTRHHLDAMIADRPVVLYSYTAHTVWANTMALEKAGLLHGADLGTTGEIVMGEDGLALGELREFAAFNPLLDLTDNLGLDIMAIVRREKMPGRTKGLLEQAARHMARLGITSIHNMDGDASQMSLFLDLEQEGRLPVRIRLPLMVMPGMKLEDLQEAVEMRRKSSDNRVRGGAVKFFADGELQSYTGWLLGEYAGRPGFTGYPAYPPEELVAMIVEADRLGLQVAIHTIGDAAVRCGLDAYAAARRTNGPRDSRHRLEHLELINPEDIMRFKELGVTASVQPIHETLFNPKSGDSFPERAGRDRWHLAYQYRTVLESGARVVFGSDWPVADANPILGVSAAVNREFWAEGLPDQRFSISEALAAYTTSAAAAEFQEQHKGRLCAGMLADLVLLSKDLTAIPAEDIRTVSPVMTVCDGEITYEG